MRGQKKKYNKYYKHLPLHSTFYAASCETYGAMCPDIHYIIKLLMENNYYITSHSFASHYNIHNPSSSSINSSSSKIQSLSHHIYSQLAFALVKGNALVAHSSYINNININNNNNNNDLQF